MSTPGDGAPDTLSGRTLDDLNLVVASARRHADEAAALMHKRGVLPGEEGGEGDPDSDVGRLEDDTPLRRAQNTADRIKQQQQQDLGEGGGGGGGGSLEGGERDVRAADQDTAGGGGGGGLLAATGHALASVLGNFSEAAKTGIDSAVGALSAPVHDRHEHQGAEDKDTGGGGSGSGGGGGLRVRDLLGGPQSDTPYPGDMADEPVQLEGGEQDASSQSTPPEPQPGRDIVSEGARGGDPVPHVAQSAARRRDPAVVAPLEGGAASTVRDSGVMVNLGPTAGGGARAQGFGFQGPEGDISVAGVAGGLLGAIREAVGAVTGRHTGEAAVGGIDDLGGGRVVLTPVGRGEEVGEAERLQRLKEQMVGMPGSMPIDQEIREMKAEERVAALAAQREAVSAASRDIIAERHPEVAERMHMATHQNPIADGHGWEQQERERQAAAAAAAAEEGGCRGGGGGDGGAGAVGEEGSSGGGGGGGGGGGLLSSLVHTFEDVLGIRHGGGGGGGGGGEREREGEERGRGTDVQSLQADLPRAPVPTGTSALEAKPAGGPEAKLAIGVPPAAEADAERGSVSLNTKQSGREVPAGALGSTVTDPSQHNQSYAPDFNKPNFFKEVEKRGVVDVLRSGAASLAANAEHAAEEFRHGGAPAPGATTAGSVSDTRDISRNVERAAYLAAAGEAADPLQRRIYDAETTKIAPGKSQAAEDKRSEAEAVKEANNAMVLGKDRQVSGAVPHEHPQGPHPQGPHPARPVKAEAGQSFYGSMGTGGS
ncbi:hypothetical protein CHLRE_06g293450v5 [Chlamydomonas reinhardtii]|uniref:Uncharacterized protein n=1 Tax=Chlamydomonas reinhardtii TaxID=3055 RepID=A0A2K3DQF3_CHLRE|nr:uncharacterized protein CHLRE_06g293450v5 [Chlamydomonas reinhardtii]PNW82772.1 hypothetical protein CHLRE_06g293450v5 [Chlamydomonas reinhardtii]